MSSVDSKVNRVGSDQPEVSEARGPVKSLWIVSGWVALLQHDRVLLIRSEILSTCGSSPPVLLKTVLAMGNTSSTWS